VAGIGIVVLLFMGFPFNDDSEGSEDEPAEAGDGQMQPDGR
jgi:hypothetical protein